jgi:hypothetical protein
MAMQEDTTAEGAPRRTSAYPRLTGRAARHARASPTWVPRQEGFPSLDAIRQVLGQEIRALPAPLPERPTLTTTTSSRLKTRFHRRLTVWKRACQLISSCNALYTGGDPHRAAWMNTEQWQGKHCAAWAAMQQRALRLASAAVKERRGPGPTGVQALATLLRLASHGYSVTPGAVRQVPLYAQAIDEPPAHIQIQMLDALPPEEAEFYASEANVVDRSGKAEAVSRELEEQYSFLGGDYRQWVLYLNRPDLAAGMWSFLEAHDVKAVSGISAVPKKDATRQRKLLMSVVTNYWWCDVRRRRNFGLG